MKLFPWLKKEKIIIRERKDHCLSRRLLSQEAIKVLRHLSESGYKAYLVGGCVRDILLGRQPKDFDVVTDAHPREIKRIFRNSFIVGRRFRLVHVVFGKTVIETATFRAQPPKEKSPRDDGADDLYQHDDNTFGTPREDAFRRDFTINALFYDYETHSIIDYTGGLRDLDNRVLRCIDDPNVRYREDPVRMMRAIRLSSKLGLKIDARTRRAIFRHHQAIEQATAPRLLEEILRLFVGDSSELSFRLLWETRLMENLLPNLAKFINKNGGKNCDVWKNLAERDKLAAAKKTEIEAAVSLAALYRAPFNAVVAETPRQRRFLVACNVIRTMNDKYKLPRNIFERTAHILANGDEDELPPKEQRAARNRRRRSRRNKSDKPNNAANNGGENSPRSEVPA